MSIEIDIVESAPFNSSYNKKVKDKEYNGVGVCLFAEVCKRSFDLNYDGYVGFMAKTNLIEYYKKELGASLIGSQRMIMKLRLLKNLWISIMEVLIYDVRRFWNDDRTYARRCYSI